MQLSWAILVKFGLCQQGLLWMLKVVCCEPDDWQCRVKRVEIIVHEDVVNQSAGELAYDAEEENW